MKRRTFFTWFVSGWLVSFGFKLKQNKSPAIKKSYSPITYYISPQGIDTHSGKSPEEAFATLQQARDAIRQLKKQQGDRLLQPVNVILREGTYYLEQPLKLTPQDSGEEKALITYEAYPEEKPVISGGKIIRGWQEATVNGKRMWTVTIPEVQTGKWYFQQLWVNGIRRNRSRYPSQGYLSLKNAPPTKNWQKGNNSFYYFEGDLPNNISWNGAEAVVMNRWVESRLPITKIEESSQTISFSKKTVFALQPGDLYYIENIFGLLEKPGEWYLDREEGKLYYLPLSEEKLESTEIIAPFLSSLFILEGNSAFYSYIKHLNFNQLTFSHTDWELPRNTSGFLQNAFGVPGAILANSIQHCTWNKCTLTHLGTFGIELFRGCQYNRIVNCQFNDLGGGAIKIGERQTAIPRVNSGQISHHNQVVNNHIFDGGKFFHSAVAVRTVHSHDNLISRNHIHDFYYTGISVRGTWGFEETNAYNNIIEYNQVYHIGKLGNGDGPILSDMGAIYSLGSQKGTIIRSNTVRDVAAAVYGGWGVYLDEGSSELVIENNLVYRTTHGGLMQHYGRNNLIRNNIFAWGKNAQIYRSPRDYRISQREQHNSFRFEHNIFYWDEGEFFGGVKDDPGLNAIFNYNLYWHQGEQEIYFADLSWEQWQAQGNDRNSLIADPLFISPKKANFQLKSDSPAFEIGFNPYH